MRFAKFAIISLGIIAVAGTLVDPALRAYGTQVLALLAVFYLILESVGKKHRRATAIKKVEDEETLLFLTTYLKPKLADLIDLVSHEENTEVVKKHLQLAEREVDDFLMAKEKESDEE